MEEFRPSKTKLIANTLIQTAKDKSEKLVVLLSQKYPQYASLLVLAQVSFGGLLAYKQEQLNQFIQFLEEHKEDIFNENTINNPHFRDGMAVFLEEYFKLRSEEKLVLAQNIFLDFAKSPKMPTYPLERYNDTLQKISNSGIQFLGFIDTEIPKIKREYAIYRGNQNNNDVSDDQMDYLLKTYSTQPLNFFIDEYIDKRVRKEMLDSKGEKPLEEEGRLKSELREPFPLLKSELEQLGLAKQTFSSGGIGGGESEYFVLTDYGSKFVTIIKPDDVYHYVESN